MGYNVLRMSAFRDLSILLSGCLLLSGCVPAEHRAADAWQRIVPGMTAEQVREEIGEPAQIVRGDPGQPQVWLYQYSGGPGTVTTVFLVILLLGILVLIALGGGGVSAGGDWGDHSRAEFRIHFDGNERVVELSPIQVTSPR